MTTYGESLYPTQSYQAKIKPFGSDVQGFKFPENVKASGDLEEVVTFGELLLVVIPTPFVANVMSKVKSTRTNNRVLKQKHLALNLSFLLSMSFYLTK